MALILHCLKTQKYDMKKETLTTLIMMSVLVIGTVTAITGCGGGNVSRSQVPSQVSSMETTGYCLGCYTKKSENCFGCNEASFYGCLNCITVKMCSADDVDLDYDDSSNCTVGCDNFGLSFNYGSLLSCDVEDKRYNYQLGPSCGNCYCLTINDNQSQSCVGEGCYS